MPTFSISEYNKSLLLNCRAKKMYETFSISENNESLLLICRAKNFRTNESRAKLV